MSDQNTIIDGKIVDPNPNPDSNPKDTRPAGEKTQAKTNTDPLKDAWKQVENIGQTLGEALQGRGNVVAVRVNNDTLEQLDMLVEAEIVKSRSEAAALLINEGAKSFSQLFTQVREITDQIAQLRNQLRETVQKENTKETPSSNGGEK